MVKNRPKMLSHKQSGFHNQNGNEKLRITKARDEWFRGISDFILSQAKRNFQRFGDIKSKFFPDTWHRGLFLSPPPVPGHREA